MRKIIHVEGRGQRVKNIHFPMKGKIMEHK